MKNKLEGKHDSEKKNLLYLRLYLLYKSSNEGSEEVKNLQQI